MTNPTLIHKVDNKVSSLLYTLRFLFFFLFLFFFSSLFTYVSLNKKGTSTQIAHDSTVKIKDSMKACRLDILQTFSGNYSSNFSRLKIPGMVIIQKRANGYFDMVMLGNDVIDRSMELHAWEYGVSHLNRANLATIIYFYHLRNVENLRCEHWVWKKRRQQKCIINHDDHEEF